MYPGTRDFRGSWLWWSFSIWLGCFIFSGGQWGYLALMGASILMWLLVGWLDSVIFIILRPVQRWDMVKLIHRWRYWFLKKGSVGQPRIDRTEERGGYDV